jgi:hypothetical protein
MATTAFLEPGPFLPVVVVIVHPTAGLRVELDRGDEQGPFLLDEVALLPLAADGVLDIVDAGDVDLLQRDLELLLDLLEIRLDRLRIDVGDDDVLIRPRILQHAAVQGPLPGVVVLQVAGPAYLGADIRLRLRQELLGIDRLLRPDGAGEDERREHDKYAGYPGTDLHHTLL